MTTAGYTIEARAYDIAGIACHNFWVLRDDKGQILGQLHGLATSADNRILAIGRVGDRLKFYHFGLRTIRFGLNPEDNRNYVKYGQQSKAVYLGPMEEALARWDRAANALPYLNSLDIPYTPFGIFGRTPINSNTAYVLLGKLMGVPIHLFSRYWQPGWRNDDTILTSAALAAMALPAHFADHPKA